MYVQFEYRKGKVSDMGRMYILKTLEYQILECPHWQAHQTIQRSKAMFTRAILYTL